MDSPERRIRECLSDLERYLSDHLPPLLVADSVETLLQQPTRLIIAECQSWADQQFKAHEGAVPISDLLFHGAKKLHVLGEMDLVPRQALKEALELVKAQLVAGCPESERSLLAANLERMGSGKASEAGAVEYLIRPVGERPEADGTGAEGGRSSARPLPGTRSGDAGSADDFVKEIRRFELLLDRLSRMPGAEAAAASGGVEAPASERDESSTASEDRTPADRSLLSELYASATVGARNEGELRALLGELRSVGLDSVEPSEMMQTLAAALPDWVVPEGEERPPRGTSAEAMERLVTLAEDEKEARERLWELVKAAIDQVNEGAIGRAMAILEVAERLLETEEVPEEEAQRVRGRADQFLDTDRLLELAADPGSHRPLRRILDFFPKLHPQPLLHRLESSEERHERRMVLSLLGVHGLRARGETLDRLEGSRTSEHHEVWQIQRNLIYLLRRIEVPGGEPAERELQLVLSLSTLDHALPLVREAVGYLGQVGGERAVGTLLERLREVESFLESKDPPPHPPGELRKLLSLLAIALVRTGDPAARAEVVRHGFEQRRSLGKGGERLATLGTADLSSTPELVDRLLEELRRSSPMKVLGLTVHRQTERAAYLIQALAGTPLPRVRDALQGLVDRFPATGLADLAREVLEAQTSQAEVGGQGEAVAPEPIGEVDEAGELRSAAPAKRAPDEGSGLQGDLDLFGLPALLQSLAQAQRTGVLRIEPEDSEVHRTILVLREGRLVSGRRGDLRDESAFFSIVEEPFSGSFHFSSREVLSQGEGEQEVMPMLVEGMRRFDELRRARAVVPEDLTLEPTGTPPESPAGEEGAFVHEVWSRVKRGESPREIEQAVAVDPYRVHSLLAHWVEGGALRHGSEEDS